ncbi:phosphate ABC transporter, ATP-binding protein, partial [Vibrio parahaemolyticus EKP-028]
DYITGRYG